MAQNDAKNAKRNNLKNRKNNTTSFVSNFVYISDSASQNVPVKVHSRKQAGKGALKTSKRSPSKQLISDKSVPGKSKSQNSNLKQAGKGKSEASKQSPLKQSTTGTHSILLIYSPDLNCRGV